MFVNFLITVIKVLRKNGMRYFLLTLPHSRQIQILENN